MGRTPWLVGGCQVLQIRFAPGRWLVGHHLPGHSEVCFESSEIGKGFGTKELGHLGCASAFGVFPYSVLRFKMHRRTSNKHRNYSSNAMLGQ